MDKKEPSIYTASIASILKNFVLLYQLSNQSEKAKIAHIEALKLYKILAKKNLYDSDYIELLNMGVVFFDNSKKDLDIALKVLSKYSDDNDEVKRLTEMVNIIRGKE